MKHRSPRRRTQNSGERNHNNTEVKTGLETREGRKEQGAGGCVQSPPEKPGTWGHQTVSKSWERSGNRRQSSFYGGRLYQEIGRALGECRNPEHRR